jgi:hypothetical protein
MQITEVEVLGNTLGTFVDVTVPGDPIIASSNNSPGNEGVANAIDNQPTKYLNFDELNTGFTVSPMSGFSIVRGLSLTSANDAPERDPASYLLQGSNDGVNFVAIASGSIPAFTSRFQKQTITFANDVPFSRYRLVFPTVANSAAANSMQITEVELLGILSVNLPGDYNNNGTIDAVDYVVWRNTLGQVGPNLAADGNGDNMINSLDYNVWRSNFGKTSPGSGAGIIGNATDLSTVPEPTAWMLFLLAMSILQLSRPSRRNSQRLTRSGHTL